ncbi:MAG: CdaR family protein, partial [Oscillospiraceae bacterium]
FTFKTDKIKVSVPVSKKKVVPVKPTFLNLPEAYAVNGVPCTLSYETITIIGPPEIVDAVSEIPLLPIDFENVTSTNKSFDVTLDLPNAVKTIDKIEFITVAFNFKNMSEKVFSISEFVPINLAGGLSVDLPSSIRNVKVCGPTSVLRRLNASDIFAEIDFSGKHVGEYTLVAKIRIKSNNEVWAIGSYNLIATVK